MTNKSTSIQDSNNEIHHITILFVTLTANLFAQSETRSTIGSYYIGLGYRGYSDDVSDFDSLVIDSNFPVHPNFDLGVGGYIGSISVLNLDLLSYGVDVDAKIHNKFDLGSATIDPYFSLGIGLSAIESFNWYYVGSDYYYNYYQTVSSTSLLVPYNLSIGSEFTFGNFFSLVPAIGVSGLLNEDVDNTFQYGIQANFCSLTSSPLAYLLSGDDESGKQFSILGRYHL